MIQLLHQGIGEFNIYNDKLTCPVQMTCLNDLGDGVSLECMILVCKKQKTQKRILACTVLTLSHKRITLSSYEHYHKLNEASQEQKKYTNKRGFMLFYLLLFAQYFVCIVTVKKS